MKIGVTQWTLDKQGVDALARAADLGFSALQLGASAVSQDNTEAYLNAVNATGIRLLSIGVNSVISTSFLGSKPNRDQAVKLIEDALVCASQLNIPLVYVPAFGDSEMKSKADIKLTAEVFADMASLAAEHKLSFASENTLNTEEQLEFVSLVDKPNFKLFFDTQNPVLWGHNSAQLVTDLKDHLCSQLHLKDGSNGKMGNTLLAEGEAHFLETCEAVKKLDWEPVFISETDYSFDTELRAKKDLETIRKIFLA